MLVFVGVTWIDESVAGFTVSVAVPETKPEVAVIVIGPPALSPVARPSEPSALLMEAMLVSDDVQVTEAVRS